jgi:hypothetical protein
MSRHYGTWEGEPDVIDEVYEHILWEYPTEAPPPKDQPNHECPCNYCDYWRKTHES